MTGIKEMGYCVECDNIQRNLKSVEREDGSKRWVCEGCRA